MRVLLVRHPETVAGRQKRYQGFTDTPLTRRGQAQARTVCETLSREPLRAVYASDLPRALGLAKQIGYEHHLPVQIDERLREASFGRFEGLTYAQVMASDPEEANRWYASPYEHGPPGGESACDVLRRMKAAMLSICARHGMQDTVAVVSHGGPIRLWLADAWFADPTRFWEIEMNWGAVVPWHTPSQRASTMGEDGL